MIKNELYHTDLKTSDFYYDLPQKLIAQTPVEPRDSSRLMTVDRRTGKTGHGIFRDIENCLQPGDVLVINDSKVIPARLYGIKEDSGIEVEVVLLRSRGLDVWETLTRPGRRCRPGTKIVFGGGLMRGEVIETVNGGNRLIKFSYDGNNIFAVLDKIGQMPLPPYITEKLKDRNRYQTVYAREPGSAAAPTAGLHFTKELLQEIGQMGVSIAKVTLHVGLGTFRPVKEENILDHHMHSEYYTVTEETAQLINQTRAEGGRIICVGTTSTRTLESVAAEDGTMKAASGWTDIFIYPGYRFKVTDALITNFHLPESTLVMLVSAFSTRENILHAYQVATQEKYRFFSFGDAMFLK